MTRKYPLTLADEDDMSWIINAYGFLLPQDNQWRTSHEFASLVARQYDITEPHNAEAYNALTNPPAPYQIDFRRNRKGKFACRFIRKER